MIDSFAPEHLPFWEEAVRAARSTFVFPLGMTEYEAYRTRALLEILLRSRVPESAQIVRSSLAVFDALIDGRVVVYGSSKPGGPPNEWGFGWPDGFGPGRPRDVHFPYDVAALARYVIAGEHPPIEDEFQ